jgi:hypothetical protein
MSEIGKPDWCHCYDATERSKYWKKAIAKVIDKTHFTYI